MQNGLEHSLQPQQNGTSDNDKVSTINANDATTSHIDLVHSAKSEDNSDELRNEEPPSKRRKLAEAGLRHRPVARAISPPWKKIVVEGPTSFVEEGKRRSARTNVVPLELRPLSAKRQTRAANHVARSGIKNKSARLNLRRAMPHTSPSTPLQTYGRSNRTSGRITQSASNRQPTKSQMSPTQQPSTTPSKRPYHRRINATPDKSQPVATMIGSPSQAMRRGPGRPRKHPAPEVSQNVTNGRSEREESEEDGSAEEEVEEDEVESEEEDESMDELPVDPNFKPQRLKFKVKMPTLVVQHPAHIPAKKHHSSFREWVEEADPFEGSNPRLSGDQVKREARSRLRLFKAAEAGGILSGTSSLDIPEPEEEPPRQYYRHDHLLAHAQDMQRRMVAEKKKHTKWAKKLADDLIAYWHELQPKSEETIQREKAEATESIAFAVMRQCIHDLALKWELLRAEVDKQRLKKWEEEQEVLGKQALNKVLEQSSLLLDARMRRASSGAVSNTEDSDGADEETSQGSEDGSKPSHIEDERNMSSNDSEDDEASQNNEVDDDENLTVEELRLKYGRSLPPEQPISEPRLNEEEPLRSPVQKLDLHADALLADPESSSTRVSPRPSAAQDTPPRQDRQAVFGDTAEEMDDVLMDETDESTDMDDDMGDSDENTDEEGSEGEVDGSSQASGNSPTGLLGFFSKKDLTIEDTVEDSPKRITVIHDLSDEEIEEVSLIPDATQVQTPSASNSEEPSMSLSKDVDLVPQSRLSGLQEPSPVVDQRPEETTSTQVMRLPTAETNEESLPATPMSSRPVKTQVPSLLRGTLREYQHYGLDWLAALYANATNGILADEMGLGKTIQTISLLAHLAVEYKRWGPHLIVVPTSVMLNWEMEFKKFLPGFKVMTYYGSQEERKQKRKGWLDDNKWNVVITSYQLVLQDQVSFKKRGWHYLVLDEAHNIKNFRSQRWQALLTFRSVARLLLTGTPLQNNLTELWSLLFFLMPTHNSSHGLRGFADLQEFTNWFKRPVDQILEQGRETMDEEAKEIIRRLHDVLRPYLLRRLKADVEKQMPGKYEHVVYCKLSKRQRYLYDGFMSRTATRETLASGNYLSIINCLMQLRKVCNHPDLFETRPIVTSFAMPKSAIADFEIKELLVRRRLLQDEKTRVSLDVVDLLPGANGPVSALDTIQPSRLGGIAKMRQLVARQRDRISPNMPYDGSSTKVILSYLENNRRIESKDDLHHRVYLTSLRSQRRPLMSYSLVERLKIDLKPSSTRQKPPKRTQLINWLSSYSPAMDDMVVSLAKRALSMETAITAFACVTPAVVAPDMNTMALSANGIQIVREARHDFPEDAFHEPRMRLSIAFPDKRLLQYDCGKLQRLDVLLRTLQAGGHRALIFTQMTKVLDILEQFLNIHGHRYLRLDGSTKIEQRQILTDRFNNDPRILVFILSSRSGGLGINLTGADSVIFYDLDWNPAMDKQCQDRAHRIGQTRDVHIYRFVSEYTIEANILRKANQKRMLDDVIIQEGDFTTDFFHKVNPRDAFNDDSMHEADAEASAAMDRVLGTAASAPAKLSTKIFEQVEDKEDIAAAQVAQKEVENADEADFSERAVHSNGTEVSKSSRGPLSPSSNSQTQMGTSVKAAQETTAPELVHGAVLPRTEMSVGIFAEKQAIGVDRHMVEHLEWELKDVPIGPPPGEKKKKKGGEHKVTRKR